MSDDDAIIRQRIAGRSVREIARARCAMATSRGSIIWNAKVCRPSRSETPACFCRPSAATIVLSCLVDLSDLSGLVNHVAISNAVASAAGGELGGGFGTLNLTSRLQEGTASPRAPCCDHEVASGLLLDRNLEHGAAMIYLRPPVEPGMPIPRRAASGHRRDSATPLHLGDYLDKGCIKFTTEWTIPTAITRSITHTK